jgi:hypothetical protein
MGGQGHCKHSMEKGNKTLQDKYKKGSSRAKKDRSLGFWFHICCRSGRIRNLQKSIVVV